MTHNQLIREISRRLPRLKRRDVEEVLEVMAELWLDELAQGNPVTIADLGKLVVEVQQIRTGGFIRDELKESRGIVPLRMRRVYFRFRPAVKLREAVDKGIQS